jgi:DnaJ-domain-containing protein 1
MTAAAEQQPTARRAPTEDEVAAAVVLNVHRLTKGATLYAADNQAAIRQLEMTRRAVIAYGKVARVNPKLFFTDKSVFVGGRLLRAGRMVYTSALELGNILQRFGIDEMAIGFDVPVEDLRLFQSAIRDALQKRGGSPAQQRYQRIRLRRGKAPGRRDDELSPQEVVVRTYAAATIVMRRFLAEIQRGEFNTPTAVIRAAQQLAEMSGLDNPAFLGTTAIYNSKHEHAGRAVNAALLGLAMGRQLTDDRRVLARIAMAALLFDVGIPRVAGLGPMGEERVGAVLPRIIEQQYPELPASAAAATWALGGFGDASIQHTVLVYESLSVAFQGPAPYMGLRQPSLQARIVAVARRFTDLLANLELELTPDQALSRLMREDADRTNATVIQLLMSSLGLFTSGSLVQLSTGQVAQVVRTSDNPMLFSFPTVRPVLDPNGVRIADAAELNLASFIDDPNGVRVSGLVEVGDDSKVERKRQRRQAGTQMGLGVGGGPRLPDPPAAASGADPFATPAADDDAFDVRFALDASAFASQQQDGAMEVALAPPERNLAQFEAPRSHPPDARQHDPIDPFAAAGYNAQDGPGYASLPAPHSARGHSDAHGQGGYGQGGYDQGGYDHGDYDHGGYDQPGYDHGGYDQPGYGQAGDAPHGYDQDGYDQDGYAPHGDEAPHDDHYAAAAYGRGVPVDSHSGAPRPSSPGPSSGAGDTSWNLGDDHDDDDDVPSMVLQAIVDGRDRDGEESDAATAVFSAGAVAASPLHALFFGDQESDDGAATRIASAESLRQTQPKAPRREEERTVPKPRASDGGLMAAARDAAMSQGTPLPADRPSTQQLEAARQGVMQRGGPVAMPPARKNERDAIAMAPTPAAAHDPEAARTQSARRGSQTADWLRQKLTGVRPTSQGSLQKTPLVHLLVYMLDRRLTGTTMLVGEGATTYFIYFERGVAAKVRTAGTVAPLDQILLEMGLCQEDALHKSLAAVSKSGELHGRYLVKTGALDVPSIRAALQWQLIRKLTFMLKLPPTTRFAYYDGINMLEDYAGPESTPADPLTIIMAGVRLLVSSSRIDDVLNKLGTAPLRLRREAPIARLGLRDHERHVVDLLRSRPMTLSEVSERQVARDEVVRTTIYALIITRSLNLGANNKAPVGEGGTPIATLWDPSGSASERPSAAPPSSPHGMDRPQPRRGTSSSRGELPRRGTSSMRGEGLPRRGTASTGGELPRRATSSSRGEALPRRGTSSRGRNAAPDPAPSRPSSPMAPPARPSSPMAPPARPSSPMAPPVHAAPLHAAPLGRAALPDDPQPTPHVAPPAPQRNRPPMRARAHSAPDNAPPAPPRRKGGVTAEQVEERARAGDDHNYFEILGVDQSATADQIQAAYFQLAKTWHPDRLPSDLADSRAKVAKIFARINEAHQTLSNADKRAEYQGLMAHGGGTARDREIVERVVDAGLLFQKGEIMLKKGDYMQAEHLVQQAATADPDQPEYQALLAWIQAHRLGAPADDKRSGHYRAQIAMLNKVIERDNDYAQAIYYRGELYKRQGDTDAAIKDFRKVMSLDPKNIDAQREVRVHDMRKRKQKGGDDAGLFGRFFKKK